MRNKILRVLFYVFLSASIIGCGSAENKAKNETEQIVSDSTSGSKTNVKLAESYDAVTIELDDSQILVDGRAVSTSDSEAVYTANDIVFYLEGQDFTYGEGTKEDEHSKQEADAHTVVHITKPGNYVVSGSLSKGQIAVDLGDGAKKDEDAVVTLILNNADITCDVAPAVIFYNVYECGSDDADEATKDVDTSKAGANVIIADSSVNNVTGSYVARIYESVELSEDGTEVIDSKKLHKFDAAFYSRRTMNISGEVQNTGVLNIMAENEGLDTELHLTINGGNINITSGNDGINTNEDGISVTTINGGTLNIVVDGSTGEGDGIDSNGWLVINGGTVTAAACSFSMDSGIDSDMGIHINGGTVLATGNMLDEIAESEQNYVVFAFDGTQKAGSVFEIKADDESVVGTGNPINDFSILIFSGENLKEGTYTLYRDSEIAEVQESNGVMEGRPKKPEGMEWSADGEMPEGMEFPKDGEIPQLPEGIKRPGRGKNDSLPERIELPTDGEKSHLSEGMKKPMDGWNGATDGEIITAFEIKEGCNMFRVITTE